jgi:2'-5' RNA ligase
VRPGQPLTRRLFIAFRLPAPVVEALVIWQHDTIAHISSVRLTSPAQLHVTAVFLGSTPATEVQAVTEVLRHAMRRARCPIFRIDRYRETARVGMLMLREELVANDGHPVARGHAREGATGDPWNTAGVPATSTERASELTGHLMVALEASGRYVREFRAWRPHVTVARFRTPPRLRLDPPPVAPFAPTDVALYESALGPSGSVYTVLEAFPFRDEPPPPPANS